MTELKTVGQRIPRLDAEDKVRGRAQFAADIRLPGELAGKLLVSPHAHAEIANIDMTRAEALPGVRAVITAADIPDVPDFDPGSRFHAFLARRYVVFAGQAVAAVAADDLATAEAALDLIEIEYRPLPVISTLEQALAPDATPVAHSDQRVTWSTGGGHVQTAMTRGTDQETPQAELPNVAESITFKYGDLETAFAESDVIVENTYTVPVVHQGYIEPHAIVAWWDRPDHLTVWECVQGAFAARDLIARTLAEELMGSNPAPHSIIRIKTGAKRDGTLTGVQAEVRLDAGAFKSGWIMTVVTMALRNPYRFSAWNLKGMEILTNKASIAAYRAPGAPNAAFAIESQIDEIARRLDMDPLELRLKNLTQEGDLLASLQKQVRIGSREVLEALAERGAWPPEQTAYQGEEGWLHGCGLALGGWDGGNGPASALAMLEADGRFRILLGTVDLTGSYTSLAQIAAETLGVSVNQIVMSKASPDYAPFAPMSAGSQTIYAMGAAVLEAAADLRRKLLDRVAKHREAAVEKLAIDESGVYLPDDPETCVTFESLYQLGTDWIAIGGPLIGVGSTEKRKPAPSMAASVAEVAVDPQTGYVKLVRLYTAQDAGRAINPLLVEGQIQGGSLQSAGFALWEEIMYDAEGRILNPGLLDYRIATAADAPALDAIIVEVPGGNGPYGAKIVGEPSIVPPPRSYTFRR